MDHLFVWIVLFAGAAVILLGIFLIASEKELKVKRREIEELITKLENTTAGNAPQPVMQQPDNVGPREQSHREERQRMEIRMAELEREITAGREKIRESEILRDRLVESERAQETLRNESRERYEEIARWRERVAEGEESRRRLALLQAAYNQLIGKQTALAEQQREFQEKLAGFAQMIGTTQKTSSMSSHSHSPRYITDSTATVGGNNAHLPK